MGASKFHIAMYPWFALGHLTPFMHLSNNLAKKGHRVSFLVPKNTQYKLEPFNLHPHLISFVPVKVPHVDGLPLGAETTLDVPSSLHPLIMTAMDQTEKDIELLLQNLKVDAVFFDFTFWMPNLCRRIGIKSVYYSIITPVTIGYVFSPARGAHRNKEITESELIHPPAGFPLSSIKFHIHEAREFAARTNMKFGSNITFLERVYIGLTQSDAFACNSSRELEGPFLDYLESQFRKPVLVSGPTVPDPPNSILEERLSNWLGKFNASSVIYCAFGSECALSKDQFQELLLGFELTGLPFLAVLKPPVGVMSTEEAIPEGLMDRLNGRGMVYGGWVQQQLILEHPSVGCFVTHCGWASLSEALANKCQLVLLPNGGDQIIHARVMSEILKVGIEVEKGEEDGLFTKESVCKAVRSVTDKDSEVGKEVRSNHDKTREFLLNEETKSSYINSFSEDLQRLLG